MAASEVHFEEDDFTNERGMRLNTCRWRSLGRDLNGLVFLCHGYGVECTIYTQETGQRLASAGFDVYGIDYEGHGKSEGLRGFVPDFDDLVTDCATYFSRVMHRKENAGKPCFLVGESMGGAVSILISRRDPARWSGLVLVAPMLKISKKVKPPPLAVSMFIALSKFVPKWKIVPAKNLVKKSYKDPIKLERVLSNPYIYKGNHRVKTAVELLRVSIFVEEHLAEVSSPFLCVQGMEDCVNEPEASQGLFDLASSFDKTLKLYPGMWHGLTTGEPDDNVDLVFRDITRWLNQRVNAESSSPTLRSNSICTFTDVFKSQLTIQ